jgi:nitrite reductase/ring-hydroxylating ferredoxin subunit
MAGLTTQERFKRGAADAGSFFKYIADFIGFSEQDAAAIRETRFIIEKHIPSIVAGLYSQLLRFPATRRLFQRPDGSIDREYLELRMQHQGNFWRRAASGQYDDDFARFVDYVGRSHTAQGADPKIYIPERYVIGMIGFVQRRIAEALAAELHEIDPQLEGRAARGWNAFLMVLLEMLSRSYDKEDPEEQFGEKRRVDDHAMLQLAVETYERSLGMAPAFEYREVFVAAPGEIPEGERKIVEAGGLSIGVFHHRGEWYALHNSCLHRGGPVCQGKLEVDTLTCPWHGYQYDVRDGRLLLDPSAKLTRYPVEVRTDGVFLRVRRLVRDELEITLDDFELEKTRQVQTEDLGENEFDPQELHPGEMIQVTVSGEPVAVYNVGGSFYATHDSCTHAGGPLSQGRLDGYNIICPWHDSCFDVRSGQATCGPAKEPVRTYRVVLETGRARLELQSET